MKIKKLEILGFKSFVDRTVVHFDHNITCVVGPNGCGKSNIVDAIKWVMGEQAPSRLRGKSMDDVIFSGAEGRGPFGFAEVTLTFDNIDGLAPPEYQDYAEIEVSRRLDREGRSDYYINKAPVRLLDITNLFLGTGVGRRAYSIIEQGRIGFIVTSKPEDRRTMIEEAAGVSKFKVRKRAAERKMEHTRHNLVRVTDILGELERSISSLKRQAQKAERYKRYKKEMRELELYVASHRFLELTTQLQIVDDTRSTADVEAQAARAALAAAEASVEAERMSLQQLSTHVERAQGKTYELDNQVRHIEGLVQQQEDRLRGLAERERLADRELTELSAQRTLLASEADTLTVTLSELEANEDEAEGEVDKALAELERRRQALEAASADFAGLQAKLADATAAIAGAQGVLDGFEARRQQVRGRIERHRQEDEALSTRGVECGQRRGELEMRATVLRSGKLQKAERQTEIESSIGPRRDDLAGLDQEVETKREHLATKRSRLNSLQEIQERFEGVSAGVQAIMTRYAPTPEARSVRGVIGIVADRIDCDARYRRALSAALGERLQFVVVRDAGAARQALSFLKEQGGRATFVLQRPQVGAHVVPPLPGAAGVLGRLIKHISFAREDEEWVKHMLFDVALVDNLQTALALHQQGYQGAIVTTNGEFVRPDGTLTGGTADEAADHLLELKQESRTLAVEVTQAEAEVEQAVARQTALRTDIAQQQAAIDAARTEAHDAEIEILSAERDLAAIETDLARTGERRAEIAQELAAANHALVALDGEEESSRRTLDESRRAAEGAEQRVSEVQGVLTQRRAFMDEQAERVTELRVRATQAHERANRDRAALERLRQSIAELDERDERLRGDVTSAHSERGQASGRILLHQGRLNETVHDAAAARESLSVLRSDFDKAQTELGGAERRLRELRTGIDEKTNRVNELVLKQRELELAVEHLEEQIESKHRVELRMAVGDYHARPIPDEAVTTRVEELGRLIDRMGEINLTAIEEYEEKAERFEYLSAQKADLEDALSQLERAIRQMNRESRALFREAFAAINERFKRIFPLLFRGGKAELRLTDPGDLLDSGVDIVAQPPGKKLGQLELMSGGEKALTAVALVFAIFQYKPSPFCLLDEVDAPLDEANIGRFATSILQMTDKSQFILITHSKRTMEYADVLYGVTMEQPGISKLVSVELRGDKRPVPQDESSSGTTAAVA